MNQEMSLLNQFRNMLAAEEEHYKKVKEYAEGGSEAANRFLLHSQTWMKYLRERINEYEQLFQIKHQ